MITVVNKSTRITDREVQVMTRAVAAQVRHHAAPAWALTPTPVVYATDTSAVPPGSWAIAVLDDTDQADALGWHTEDSSGVIYGRVFAAPVLDHGGDALTADLSVASVLSHEVLETLVDPHVNTWQQTGDGTLYAVEVCDPVESDSYPVTVHGHTGAVTVSNFVTAAWFDPQAPPDSRFDYLGRVRAPFTMSRGGYVVTMHGGKVSQRFGRDYPAWRRDLKGSPLGRSARRSNAA